MQISIVDSGGALLYRGHEQNPKAGILLVSAGNIRVESERPDDASKWDGSAWIKDAVLATSCAVKKTKAEAHNRIIALVGDDAKQRNALALASTLLEKKFDGTLTANEVTMMDTLRQAQTGVVVIRTRSNELEASLTGMTTDQLTAFDPTLDEHWV